MLAIPLGVWLGHIHRGSFVAINLSNVGRAVPSLAIIAFGIALLGLGFVPTMIALVILAAPVMLTNAYVAVDSVDRDAVDAARGMGMTPGEVLLRVELPLALPLTFAGIRTATVYVIATATLAAVDRRRRARRDHRQPGQLRHRGRRGGRDRRRAARARGRARRSPGCSAP